MRLPHHLGLDQGKVNVSKFHEGEEFALWWHATVKFVRKCAMEMLASYSGHTSFKHPTNASCHLEQPSECFRGTLSQLLPVVDITTKRSSMLGTPSFPSLISACLFRSCKAFNELTPASRSKGTVRKL